MLRNTPTFRKWIFRVAAACAICVAYLGISTLWALYRFSRTKELYPKVTYAAPSFRPDVNWSKDRPANWVRLASMPRAAWLSIIAAEDGGFFKHNGVEWEQSLAKIRADIKRHQFPHGISTLNQQIAKNLYFGARPAFMRKLQEIVIAKRMDSEMTKLRILEIYMNIAEWGPDVVGIRAAARYYFRKSVSQLTNSECAMLANLLPSPRLRGKAVRDGRVSPKLHRMMNRTLRRLGYTSRAARAQLLARSER